MISLLNSFQVPGLNEIKIYRDHKDPLLFYYFKSTPHIAVDSETGKPLLSYMMIARDADTSVNTAGGDENAAEVQLGYLTITVDLDITDDEEKIIRQYLATVLNDEGTAVGSSGIKLSSIDFTSGKASFQLLEGLPEGTFKKASITETSPALNGGCKASFYSTFGAEGSQLMYKALTGSDSSDGRTYIATQAVCHYELKCAAYLPFDATVTVHTNKVYEYFKSIEEQCNGIDSNYFGKITLNDDMKKVFGTDTLISLGAHVLVSKEELQHVLSQTNTQSETIDIIINDNQGLSTEQNDEFNNTIVTALMEMITQTIIPSLFTASSSVVPQSTDDQDSSEAPDENAEGENKPKQVTSTYYKLTDDIDINETRDITFNLSKSGSVAVEMIADGTVTAELTGETADSLVQIADISDPMFQILSIPVYVNADFEGDDILQIDVDIDYDHIDAETGIAHKKHKQFNFRNTSEVYNFRVTMARDSDGKLIEDYNIKSRIIYKGRDADGENDGWTATKPSKDRTVVISYDKLGYINVKCEAVDVDWNVIKEAVVSLEYKEAEGAADAKSDIRLTADNPNGRWTCYKHDHESNQYFYKVRYIYADGTEKEGPELSDTKSELGIKDLLTGRLESTFDVVMDSKTVSRVKLEVLYEDEKLGISETSYKWFQETDSWDWSMRLQEGAQESFRYRYFVQYEDGNTETSSWSDPVKQGDDIPKFNFKRTSAKLLIDGSTIKWTKWAFVYVDVTYSDLDNDYTVNEMLRIDSENNRQTFEVKAFSAENKSFTCAVTFVSPDGDMISLEPKEYKGFLVLTEPKTE